VKIICKQKQESWLMKVTMQSIRRRPSQGGRRCTGYRPPPPGRISVYRELCITQEHRHYNCHNNGHYPSSCLLFKTQLDSIGLSEPHRNHVTSPLRAQQVNAIYRFVTMVYLYNYHSSGHYPSSCLLLKTRRFGDWIVSIFK
jgi:hypothetical protein